MATTGERVRRGLRACSLALLVGSCTHDEAPDGPPVRDCTSVVWAWPSHPSASVQIVGSWDDWASPGASMLEREDGWRVLGLDLPPGEYGYLVVDGGSAQLDEHNPLTSFRASDGREVSRLEVDDCGVPALQVLPDQVRVDAAGLTISALFLAVQASAQLDPGSVQADLQVDAAAPEDGTIDLSSPPLARGRHGFELHAKDLAGRAAQARVSVFVDPIAPSWADAIIYQVVTDRFFADDGLPLAAPPSPGARAGGTLGGVQAALESGYFEALGVSALWLSPVYENPLEPRLGTDGRLYEGYHGYWVADSRAVEPRIGGEQALRSLIDVAHARGIAVILDVVPNHVYETHEIVAAQRANGWFNEHPSECVCGTPSCPWATNMQDCWFAPYLPDLRLENGDAMNFAVAELLWWLDSFEVDGVRVDAVPMMPRAASRRIVHAVHNHTAPGIDRLVLGEVFTGSGTPGVAGLRHYLGPGGLDSVFDFPLMWALRDVLATDSAGFTTLDALLGHIDAQLGSGAVLARMLGNHDVERFVSTIIGDAHGDPWDQPASQPDGVNDDEARALDRVALALTLQLTLPGMPVIYYGDELALAGGDDPDNRRVMPALSSLPPARAALLERARTLGQLRRCAPALRSPHRQTLHVGQSSYAYARLAEDGGVAVVLISRADEPQAIPLPGTDILSGTFVDALGGGTHELGAGAELVLGPRSAMVLLPVGDPCSP
ncbi:Periplasmic alpha-amylase [Enhygromyxa salina]|uniref:Periplasmic alpha-amylase n=1 Tax=Enhygromyxa salina TaxID=215803 RepID=A0A0C2CNS9_9BACT|nr:alpha-amylase family glycosyl hydrolase [Enhygromyxa salina]KIG12886.1 Periplasmic alpha-amylase [Enhygromyxa salina]